MAYGQSTGNKPVKTKRKPVNCRAAFESRYRQD